MCTDGAYWQVSGGHHFSLEATAYALLALVKVKNFEAAGKAVHWLSRQSSPYGGHGTTQVSRQGFFPVSLLKCSQFAGLLYHSVNCQGVKCKGVLFFFIIYFFAIFTFHGFFLTQRPFSSVDLITLVKS